jgi:colanic acid/amylovoran biosynthesis glycosyltransferase
LRLAVFTNQFPGQVSTFFARDIRGLLASGIEIDIFPLYPLDSNLWRYVPSILNETVLPRNRIHHISLGQSLRWSGSFQEHLAFLRDTASISSATLKYGPKALARSTYVFLKAWAWAQQFPNEYDHVLAYWGNYTATGAYIYHRLQTRQIPFSIFLHAGMDLYRPSGYIKQKLIYTDNIITCSEFNWQFIQNNFPDIFSLLSKKLFVHHHGLDFSEFPFNQGCRVPRRVISVGRLEARKGFDYLLYAIHELSHRGMEIELELIGDGPQANSLTALAHKLQIEQQVKFRGWLIFDEVRTAMQQASVLVHPSPTPGDGVPNVIKEAMAIGTPVIASGLTGIPELLDHGAHGILVPPKDVETLANAIERLLNNSSLQQHYAKAARKYAEDRFDLWRNGQILADRLRSTIRSES